MVIFTMCELPYVFFEDPMLGRVMLFPVGGESSLRFSKAFFKGKPQFRVLCLPCVCPNRFECTCIQDVFCTRSSKKY